MIKKSSSILRRLSFKSGRQQDESVDLVSAPEPLNVISETQQVTTNTQDEAAQSSEAALAPPEKIEISRRPSKKNHIRTTCAVCEDEFQHPKLLPCEHYFCAKCLKPYVNPIGLLSCPTCREEVSLKEGDPSNLPDHTSVMHAVRNKKTSLKGTSTCVTCHLSNHDNKFCMHCQKVYCNLCLVEHIGILKALLEGMKNHLNEAKKKISDKTAVEEKYREIKTKMDRIEEDQISQIRELKSAGIAELEKKKSDEEKSRSNVEKEIDSILADSNQSLLEQESDQVIKHFTDIHSQFQKALQKVEAMTSETMEIDEKFRVRHFQKLKSKKKSLTMVTFNGAAPVIEGKESVNFSALKKSKISELKPNQRPTCASVCPRTGDIYVCVPESKCIQVLSGKGNSQSTIEGAFLFPIKVDFSVDSSDIYVLDKWKHVLNLLNQNHEVVRILAKSGRGVGHLQSPCGLAVDPETGNILVADTGNDRVQVLTKDGQFVRLIGGVTQTDKHGRISFVDTELSQPEDVAVCSEGHYVAVADTGNNRIRVYTTSGDPLHEFGMRGNANGQFNLPTIVAIHLGQYVIVAESGNPRVQVFNLEDGRFIYCYNSLKSISSIRETGSQTLILSETRHNSIFMLA